MIALAWLYIICLNILSLGLLTGMIHITGTVPAWVVLLVIFAIWGWLFKTRPKL
jgi:hypothetical protein